MNAITLSVEIKEDHRLVIDLPADTPVGTAQVTIYPHGTPESNPTTNPARERARAILLAAGVLSTAHFPPEDARPLSPEERERFRALFSQGRPSDELINEDRGLY